MLVCSKSMDVEEKAEDVREQYPASASLSSVHHQTRFNIGYPDECHYILSENASVL